MKRQRQAGRIRVSCYSHCLLRTLPFVLIITTKSTGTIPDDGSNSDGHNDSLASRRDGSSSPRARVIFPCLRHLTPLPFIQARALRLRHGSHHILCTLSSTSMPLKPVEGQLGMSTMSSNHHSSLLALVNGPRIFEGTELRFEPVQSTQAATISLFSKALFEVSVSRYGLRLCANSRHAAVPVTRVP